MRQRTFFAISDIKDYNNAWLTARLMALGRNVIGMSCKPHGDGREGGVVEVVWEPIEALRARQAEEAGRLNEIAARDQEEEMEK